MAKQIIIHKHRDKIEIRDPNGDLICDIIVADSSRTQSVNLSVQANREFVIDKVRQENQKKGFKIKKYTEEEQLERRKADHAAITGSKVDVK